MALLFHLEYIEFHPNLPSLVVGGVVLPVLVPLMILLTNLALAVNPPMLATASLPPSASSFPREALALLLQVVQPCSRRLLSRRLCRFASIVPCLALVRMGPSVLSPGP